MKKPWERGYIPKPGPKQVELKVQTPEGWVRVKRRDCIEFRRSTGLFSCDQITGRPGGTWSLRLRVLDIPTASKKPPTIELRSLKALIVWYEVDKATRDDRPFDPYLEAAQSIGTNREAAKAILHGLAYGSGSGQLDAYAQLLRNELRTLRRKAT